MNITCVTITGADNDVNPEDLIELTAKYPFVEWGILASRKSFGRPRFPSIEWITDLCRHEHESLKLSLHLCGEYVKEVLNGIVKPVFDEIGTPFARFKRMQLNTHGELHQYSETLLPYNLTLFPDKELIVQYDDVNRKIFLALLTGARAFEATNFSTLFDLSHGEGRVPKNWSFPIEGVKCGYAGGLTPDNLAEQLELISRVAQNAEIWIDMETGVRTNNNLDLAKVDKALYVCQGYFK